MPQLDITSFFSQYVWLVVFYLGFYFLLVNSFLPKLSRILKVRAAKRNSVFHSNNQNGSTSSTNLLQEQANGEKKNVFLSFSMYQTRETIAIMRFKFAQNAVRQGFLNVNTWIDSTTQDIRSTYEKNTILKFKELVTNEALLQASIHQDVQNLLPFYSITPKRFQSFLKKDKKDSFLSFQSLLSSLHIYHTKKTLSILTLSS